MPKANHHKAVQILYLTNSLEMCGMSAKLCQQRVDNQVHDWDENENNDSVENI